MGGKPSKSKNISKGVSSKNDKGMNKSNEPNLGKKQEKKLLRKMLTTVNKQTANMFH